MKNKDITDKIKIVFSTEAGKSLLDHLEKVFVDRPIYKREQTLADTAYRQGQADVIKQLINEIKGT